ncbi:unnamed protein product [Closterium sp. NIES-53]
MHNGASRANRLRAPVSVCTAVFYEATLDSRSAAALAHRRLAVLAGRLSAVLARLLYATLAGGRPCCAGYTFSLGSGSVSRRSTRSSSVLSSSCEAEIYAEAMAAQEVRWLTYLLSDLRERPRSPPFLYVDNKAMIALCQEHRLEHKTKHIALRYFLARELQQRGQPRLAYVATRANTADIFTKALPPSDHQRFSTVLDLLALLFLTGLVALAPTCVPCVEGRQRAAPHSSTFPPTEAPLQTLHMDVWGPARVRGQGHEHYFLLVVDDYSRYATFFPLRSKGEVPEVLIDWIRGARRQLRESFGSDLPVLRLHPDRGGEFSSDLLRAFCRAEGIRQTFTLPASPQKMGLLSAALAWLAMRRVLSSQDVTFDESVSYYRLFPYRTASLPPSPLFLAPDPAEPVEVALTQMLLGMLSLWVRGLGRVEPGGAEPGGTPCGGAEPARAESGGSPGVPLRWEPLSLQRLCEWYARRCCRATGATGTGGAAGAGAAGGAAGAGAAGGAAGAGAAGGAAGDGAAGGVAGVGAAGGAAGAGAVGGPAGVGGARAAGPGGARTRGTGAAGTRGAAGVEATGTGAGGAAGAGTADPGVVGTGAVSAVSRGAARPRPYYVPLVQQVLGLPPSPGPTPPLLSPPPVQSQSQLQPSSPLPGHSPYSGPSRGLTERREPESRPVSPESRSASPVRTVHAGRRVSRPSPPPVPGTHSMTLRPSIAPQRVPLPSPPASSLPDEPDPQSDSLCAASPTVTRFLATAVTDPLFESTAASALVAELVEFAAACRLDYATSLVAESASASICPPSVGGECALGTDVLEDRYEEFECFATAVPHLVSMLLAPEGDPDAPDIPIPRSYVEAIEGPYSSQWQAAMDAEMASWKSTGTYVDEVPPPGANIVSGMWIFRVKRPPGSPPVFKARYVARGFNQRQGVDFFHTFSPTPKMTTPRVLLYVAAQRDYELHSLDFGTTFLQGSLHEEIWMRRPSGFTGSFPPGTQWSLWRPVYGLRQAPREWHDTLRTTLATLSFAPSTADSSLFLRTDTTLPPFYVLVYVDDLVFATADTEALAHVKSELQKRHTCTDLGEMTSYLGLRITRDRAQRTITLTQSHMVQQVLQRFGFTYSSAYRSLALSSTFGRVLRRAWGSCLEDGLELSSLVTQTLPGLTTWLCSGRHWVTPSVLVPALSLGGLPALLSCEAEIYAGAMAAHELRWLTYLLTNLGEAPRSPPVLYCGELRLAYVASLANTADVFTKTLQPCDH